MSVDSFIDTNVLIYQLDARDARKHHIADAIIGQAIRDESACISFQVVQECLNTVLRKAQIGLSHEQVRNHFEAVLTPLYRVGASLQLYQRGLTLQARWKFSFYDSMIVAAALEAGCKRLLSEDLQHGQRIEGMRIENPFKS